MKEKLVTVVVPIYNVEKYLNVCLESIVNQTYRNLEIILVDDGSPDSCPQICDEWAQKDARIRVIHKENQGLGMARNTGIEHANGEYICFIDSDDYFDVHTIQKAYEKAEQYRADVVMYGTKDCDESGNVTAVYVPSTEKNIFADDQVRNEFLPDLIDGSMKQSKNKSLPFSAWSCLFSMHLFQKNGLRFVSERVIISEDSYSLLKLYNYVRSVYVINEALYYHRRNNASLSLSFRKDRFERTKDFAQKSFKLAGECGYGKMVHDRICGLFFNFTIDAMKHIVMSAETFKFKIIHIRTIIKDDFLRACLKKCRYDNTQIPKCMLKSVILARLPVVTYILVYLKTLKH